MVSIHGFCIDSCLIITFCYDVPASQFRIDLSMHAITCPRFNSCQFTRLCRTLWTVSIHLWHGFRIDSCLIITFCYDVPFIEISSNTQWLQLVSIHTSLNGVYLSAWVLYWFLFWSLPVWPRMQTTLNVPVITPRMALEVRVVRLCLGLGLGLVLGCLVGAAVVGNGWYSSPQQYHSAPSFWRPHIGLHLALLSTDPIPLPGTPGVQVDQFPKKEISSKQCFFCSKNIIVFDFCPVVVCTWLL